MFKLSSRKEWKKNEKERLLKEYKKMVEVFVKVFREHSGDNEQIQEEMISRIIGTSASLVAGMYMLKNTKYFNGETVRDENFVIMGETSIWFLQDISFNMIQKKYKLDPTTENYQRHEKIIGEIQQNLIFAAYYFIEDVPKVNNGLGSLKSNEDILLDMQFKVGASLVDKAISIGEIENAMLELIDSI